MIDFVTLYKLLDALDELTPRSESEQKKEIVRMKKEIALERQKQQRQHQRDGYGY